MLACSTSIAGLAQVFISDQLERDWLNAEIPGLVDAGGIMDTLHSGIADLDTASVVLPGSGSVEFNGIKYLDSLEVFAILSTSFSPFPITAIGFPVGLTDLSINSGIGAVTLGGLPQYLEDLSISSAPNGQISLNITAMPDTIQHFYLGNVSTITLGTLGYVADMFIMCDQLGPDPFSLPLLVVGRLNLSTVHGIAVDLSSITTDRLTILSSNIDGAISWPIGVTDLFLDAWFSVPVPAWPPTLATLGFNQAEYVCLPPFPDGMTIATFYGMPNCIPNWPASLDLISSLEGDFTQETATFCSVLNSNCPGSNPGIAGRVFMDSDADGSYDIGEPGLPQTQVVLQPNGQVTGCNGDGTWEIGVMPGE